VDALSPAKRFPGGHGVALLAAHLEVASKIADFLAAAVAAK